MEIRILVKICNQNNLWILIFFLEDLWISYFDMKNMNNSPECKKEYKINNYNNYNFTCMVYFYRVPCTQWESSGTQCLLVDDRIPQSTRITAGSHKANRLWWSPTPGSHFGPLADVRSRRSFPLPLITEWPSKDSKVENRCIIILLLV